VPVLRIAGVGLNRRQHRGGTFLMVHWDVHFQIHRIHQNHSQMFDQILLPHRIRLHPDHFLIRRTHLRGTPRWKHHLDRPVERIPKIKRNKTNAIRL
jgi:hypothetical protein